MSAVDRITKNGETVSLLADSVASPPLDPLLQQASHLPRWLWAVAGLMGACLIVLAPVILSLPLLFPLFFAEAAVVIGGYGLISMTLGVVLIIAGFQGWRKTPARRFYGRWVWLISLVASLVVAGIALLVPAELQTSLVFAPFHFALILFPALFLISIVTLLSGTAAAVVLRHLTLTVAGGAATIFLALPLELMGLFVSVVISAIVMAVVPGGAAEIERLMALLQRWSEQMPTDETEILALLASPVVLFVLALLLAVITPLVEEFGKTLVLGAIGAWTKPSVQTGFVLGVACGLGFAWLEGISNGALGLGGSLGWLGSVGARFFATAMHALTSGLLGIGWAYLWRRKWWALLLMYVLAVIFHGLWNLNVVLSIGGMGTVVSSPAIGGAIAFLGVGIQLLLVVISLTGLLVIPLVLRHRGRGPAIM